MSSSVDERADWILQDLFRQIGSSGAADVQASLDEGAGRLTVHRPSGGELRLVAGGSGEATTLTLEHGGGTTVFHWRDSVSIFFDVEGVELYVALRGLLPGVELAPAPMIAVDGLKTYFHTEDGIVKAVDGLTVTIEPGTTLGLVGESGSGKSVTSLTIMGLLPEFTARIPAGELVFMGRDLLSMRPRDLTNLRGNDVAMIFQEPMTSLNPVYTVGDQVAEAVVRHEGISRDEAMQRAVDLFREVGIPEPERRVTTYPHEMSGGQKQRVMIAMALACNPRVLIADEPTTALDVTIQKQILDLLGELRDKRGMAILFITHDLGVIAEIADKVAVMYRGTLCEYGDVLSVFRDPQHPYTRGLLACRPRLDSTYRLLPTVSDFLDTFVEDGRIQTREKKLTEERRQELLTGGRDKMPVGEGEPVLQVRDLRVWFPKASDWMGRPTAHVKAVDGISFDVYRGQTLGLVGESGCGKTTTGRAILGLVPRQPGSQITFEGQDLGFLKPPGAADDSEDDPEGNLVGWMVRTVMGRNAMLAFVFFVAAVGALFGGISNDAAIAGVVAGLTLAALGIAAGAFFLGRTDEREKAVRQRLQIIFQDPYASLNPRLTIEQTLTEPMAVHGIGADHAERVKRAGDLLEECGLSRAYLRRYPHEFSGGQRQRICIARTLALEPSLIICDESVSALDVSVQAQVLNLLKELQLKRGLTYIFISHDLSVVKFMSDVMCVMKDGIIVEAGPADDIYEHPREVYTQRLIGAIPRDDLEHIEALQQARTEARARRLAQAVSAVAK